MVNIQLEVQEVNFVIEVLSQQSYRQVAGLMNKIQQQVIPQMQAQQPEEIPTAE